MGALFMTGRFLDGVAVHGNDTDIFYEVELEGITPEELRAIAPEGMPYYEEGDFGAWFGCFSVVDDVVVYYGSAELMPESRERWAELDPVTKRKYRRAWGENAERYASVSADLGGAGYDDLNLLNEELAKYRAEGETDGRNLVACGDTGPDVDCSGSERPVVSELPKGEGGATMNYVDLEKKNLGTLKAMLRKGLAIEPEREPLLRQMDKAQVITALELGVLPARIDPEGGCVWPNPETSLLVEPARELRPDGRLLPVAGDTVYQTVAGAFGMPATIHGEVYQGKGKSGGLRVKVTGSAALIGSAKLGATYPLSDHWTVVNDPRIEGARREAKERAAAKEAAWKAEQDETEKTAQESYDAAIAAGDAPLSEDTPLGATIVEHYSGDVYILTLKSHLGFFGCEPADVTPGNGRGLGRVATWRVSVPLVDIEEEGRKNAQAFYEAEGNEWELRDALEHCDTVTEPEWPTYAYRYRDVIKAVAAKRGITLATNTMQAA